jgi:hypothetical protein
VERSSDISDRDRRKSRAADGALATVEIGNHIGASIEILLCGHRIVSV